MEPTHVVDRRAKKIKEKEKKSKADKIDETLEKFLDHQERLISAVERNEDTSRGSVIIMENISKTFAMIGAHFSRSSPNSSPNKIGDQDQEICLQTKITNYSPCR